MRIWSLHPQYLDSRGLVALWREALLAQAVLEGKTDGYRHHPQLLRFRCLQAPIGAIAEYLRIVYKEAVSRGYRFKASKISSAIVRDSITVTRWQIQFEWWHLMSKLQARDKEWWVHLESVKNPRPHPLFRVVPGPIESWEKGLSAAQQWIAVDPRSRSGN